MALYNKNKKMKTPMLVKESFLNKLGDSISSFVYRVAEKSMTAGILTRYRDLSQVVKNSLFATMISAVTGWLASLCRQFTHLMEDSFAMRFVETIKKKLLLMSMRMWGFAIISCSASMTAVIALRRYAGTGQILLDSTLIAAFAVIIMGIAMLSSGKPLWTALSGSFLYKTLFVKYAGVRMNFDMNEVQNVSAAVPVITGVLLGILSAFTTPLLVPLGTAIILGASLMLGSTEFGVMMILFALPFIQTMQLAALCIVVICSFVIKLIRGKRRVRFERMDIAILFFAAFLFLFGGLFSILPSSSLPHVALYLLFILTYFVVANTIRSRQWADKAVWTLLSAGFLSALVGIYQYASGFEQGLVWVDTEMFSEISGRVIGTFENPNVFGEFLIMLLPAAAAMFLTRRGGRKYYAAIIFLALGGSLVFTFSRGAWLAILIAFVLFLFFYSRSFFKLSLLGVFAVPFLPYLLPQSIVERFTSIGSMTDSSTAYRVYIWIASLNLIKDFWPCGIGTGVDAFMQVYPRYALSGVAMAPHAHNLYLVILSEMGIAGFICFLAVILYFFKTVFSAKKYFRDKLTSMMTMALGAGVFAYLLQGVTDNVWYNFKVVLMFWLIVGITSAYSRSYHLEWGGEYLEY